MNKTKGSLVGGKAQQLPAIQIGSTVTLSKKAATAAFLSEVASANFV